MMYAQHMPKLRYHGRYSPSGLADLVTFAVLSIRQPFMRVPEHVRTTRKLGEQSPHLWGWKLDSYRFIRSEEGVRVYDAVMASRTAPQAIKSLVEVPGLGIVKSAFVAQMLGCKCACFDSRNMKVIGGDKRRWRYDKDFSEGLLDYKIAEYCELSRERGPEYWWDFWCADVAQQQGVSAEEVSAMHMEAIG